MNKSIKELNEICRLTNSIIKKVRTNKGYKWIITKGHYSEDNYNVFL